MRCAGVAVRRLILVLDAVLVVAAMALSYGLHVVLRDQGYLRETPPFSYYAVLVYIAVPLWLGLVALFGLHRTFERTWTRLTLIVDLVKLHFVGFLALSAGLVFTQATINRSLVALFLGCSFILFYASRSVLGYWRAYQHRLGQTRLRLLVIGAGPEVDQFVAAATSAPLPPTVRVTAFGGDSVDDLAKTLHDEPVDHVLFFPPYDDRQKLADAMRACEIVGVSAELAIEMPPAVDSVPRVVEMVGRPFISFDLAPKPPESLALKHALDWTLAAIGLLLLLPLLLVVSFAILLTMGRPIFFTQTRAGLHGRQFGMIKFRTMIPGAEAKQAELQSKNEMTGPVFKVTNDPRVTRLGRLLRKTSIDELPQLVNVLTGTMSLVGPRPLPIKEQQNIRGWHRRRLSMKPGITGIWQISGRNDIDFEEWMRLDEKYVREWSLWLDLSILLKTVPTVLFGRGAK